MVESIAEIVGFEVAALSVVEGDELVTLAYTGPEEHRAFMEEPDPVSVIAPLLARATSLGERLRFLESTPLEELEGHWIRVEQVPTDHPDAWEADDGLLAVLSADDGTVVGILSVDRPSSGRRPDPHQLSLLERYAAQAERAVLTLFDTRELLEQAAHAASARQLVRSASRPTLGSLTDVLRHTHGQLVAGFDACGSWLHVFEPEGPGTSVARTEHGQHVEVPLALLDQVALVAPELWRRQAPLLTGPWGPGSDLGHGVEGGEGMASAIRRQLLGDGGHAVLGVALGVGEECVGFMALSRLPGQRGWSPVEIDSALQVGHDLGAALMTARALERERRLVADLQRVEDYRSQLVAMLSHELRTPLTVISGNLELLGEAELDPTARRHHEAMRRGTDRMGTVVDDLLLLARVSNPDHPLVTFPLDVRAVCAEAVALVESTARAKTVDLALEVPDGPLVTLGDAVELDRLVGNLVSNAVKYTPTGGTVTVSCRRDADSVVLTVNDSGIGISEDDQRELFRAFFRSTNPAALRESGTGLGLTTVATIAARHGGRVQVASRLGEGSTFTVTLPAA
jgi:signal transduction histidine kinase